VKARCVDFSSFERHTVGRSAPNGWEPHKERRYMHKTLELGTRPRSATDVLDPARQQSAVKKTTTALAVLA